MVSQRIRREIPKLAKNLRDLAENIKNDKE